MPKPTPPKTKRPRVAIEYGSRAAADAKQLATALRNRRIGVRVDKTPTNTALFSATGGVVDTVIHVTQIAGPYIIPVIQSTIAGIIAGLVTRARQARDATKKTVKVEDESGGTVVATYNDESYDLHIKAAPNATKKPKSRATRKKKAQKKKGRR